MDLNGIVALKGQSGLFRIISKMEYRIIVESLTDKRRMPYTDPFGITILDGLKFYGKYEDEDIMTVFKNIHDMEATHPIPETKADNNTYKQHFILVYPEYDEERLFVSDMKKIYLWYTILKDQINFDEINAADDSEESSEENTEAQN
ncbi:MAG: DUF5606 domain-containing protein [Bacteroidota bacterium]